MIITQAAFDGKRPSLAMNIAVTFVTPPRNCRGVFSLKMTSESPVLRMLCSRSCNLRISRTASLAERDFPKLTGAASAAG